MREYIICRFRETRAIIILRAKTSYREKWTAWILLRVGERKENNKKKPRCPRRRVEAVRFVIALGSFSARLLGKLDHLPLIPVARSVTTMFYTRLHERILRSYMYTVYVYINASHAGRTWTSKSIFTLLCIDGTSSII